MVNPEGIGSQSKLPETPHDEVISAEEETLASTMKAFQVTGAMHTAKVIAPGYEQYDGMHDTLRNLLGGGSDSDRALYRRIGGSSHGNFAS